MVELAGAIDEVVAIVTIDAERITVACTGKALAANTVLAGTLIALAGAGIGEMMAAIAICAGLGAILGTFSAGLGSAIGTAANVGFAGAFMEPKPGITGGDLTAPIDALPVATLDGADVSVVDIAIAVVVQPVTTLLDWVTCIAD